MLTTYQLTKRDLLKGEENVDHSHKMARNSIIFTLTDGTEICKYVNTHVITKKPDGSIILQSGGFRTVTTLKRIHDYCGIRVFQKLGIWYMPDGSLFYDGITLKDGKIISEIRLSTKQKQKEILQMKKKIKEYAKLITPWNFPKPSQGDCVYCAFKIETTKSPVDIQSQSGDHLISHLEEGYVVGSLLINAMREDGMDDDSIGFSFSMPAVSCHRVRKSVERYLTRRLLPEVAPA